jgi:hypothetical protein
VNAADPLPWLLEENNPSARYWALTSLRGLPGSDPEVRAARDAIPFVEPARGILNAQWPQGYWIGPGVGYSPKHKATIWQIIFLGALGAPRTEAIDRACDYVLQNSRLPDGRFSAYRSARGATLCLNGNLLKSMRQLGVWDPRLDESLEALAETIHRHGFRCRFNVSGPPPPRMSDGMPCAWGSIKALGALATVQDRSPRVQAAIARGIDFLFSADLARGDYPTATGISPQWHQFGFPLGYASDLLEALDVLGQLGCGADPRLAAAVQVVVGKRDHAGRWNLDNALENTWASFGRPGHPNKWVTVRALQALRHYASYL